jgi:hypothetical protein
MNPGLNPGVWRPEILALISEQLITGFIACIELLRRRGFWLLPPPSEPSVRNPLRSFCCASFEGVPPRPRPVIILPIILYRSLVTHTKVLQSEKSAQKRFENLFNVLQHLFKRYFWILQQFLSEFFMFTSQLWLLFFENSCPILFVDIVLLHNIAEFPFFDRLYPATMAIRVGWLIDLCQHVENSPKRKRKIWE